MALALHKPGTAGWVKKLQECRFCHSLGVDQAEKK